MHLRIDVNFIQAIFVSFLRDNFLLSFRTCIPNVFRYVSKYYRTTFEKSAIWFMTKSLIEPKCWERNFKWQQQQIYEKSTEKTKNQRKEQKNQREKRKKKNLIKEQKITPKKGRKKNNKNSWTENFCRSPHRTQKYLIWLIFDVRTR